MHFNIFAHLSLFSPWILVKKSTFQSEALDLEPRLISHQICKFPNFNLSHQPTSLDPRLQSSIKKVYHFQWEEVLYTNTHLNRRDSQGTTKKSKHKSSRRMVKEKRLISLSIVIQQSAFAFAAHKTHVIINGVDDGTQILVIDITM